MKQGILTHSDTRPQSLFLRNIHADIYELSAAENIKETAAHDCDEMQTAPAVQYEYILFADTRKLSGYEDAVAALIGLKYTTGDEFSLMRKGMTDTQNVEYTAYLAYVAACKICARAAFGITETEA